jgi:hypothetical protein
VIRVLAVKSSKNVDRLRSSQVARPADRDSDEKAEDGQTILRIFYGVPVVKGAAP